MGKILNSKWKESFATDILIKIKYADKEFDSYLKTGYVIHLQQAGNKLFSAVENFMMLKYDNKVRSYQKILKIVSSNQRDAELLTQASQLHYFYYNGELQMDKNEAVILYKLTKRKLRSRLKSLK